jgi:hypothetical protein
MSDIFHRLRIVPTYDTYTFTKIKHRSSINIRMLLSSVTNRGVGSAGNNFGTSNSLVFVIALLFALREIRNELMIYQCHWRTYGGASIFCKMHIRYTCIYAIGVLGTWVFHFNHNARDDG